MSRIGKRPIQILDGVEAKIENGIVEVKGPKGVLKMKPISSVDVLIEGNEIKVAPRNLKEKNAKAFWGLTRTLIANMIDGVTKGYEKKLELNGVGFKARIEGKDLILDLGFSHPVKVEAPDGINFLVEKNVITVSGINKELVGQTAASIRRIRPPEPYKGKGIKYQNEILKKKLGKKAAGAS
ncbi:MAG TPA: 50S ribosomal protein L6 [Candidatus Pacearchaeota archaeon]|jgi:large subunit ribosomal protein L6|nr:50S ribosomal protein L6 [Candidatus Pacearchaeota archaeon]HRR94541.1 50S ribosomal protein L6 [Candidatus Paceibacterota bacterium]HPC30406.1 50S ribosomal protein L6 [Candidatus Pacearchaeota archaeon]HQG09100.1 50S ribosomal protein L6 [Candidatus Pacearchaeota archaeon]HQH20084.1 50S ribosomal protein L6 [Candidatus Pacearchaeota archaeon]